MPPNITGVTEFETSMAAGSAVAKPIIDGVAAPVIVVPAGYKMESLEQFMPKPARKGGTASLSTAGSFIGYVNEHKTIVSRIFAEVTDTFGKFTAILDFHGAASDASAWAGHKAVFVLEQTTEWKRWMQSDRKKMSQNDFALFLEENQNIFVAPDGAKLMELVLALEGKQEANFTNVTRLQNGSCKLAYEENVSVSGTNVGAIEMPSVLEIGVAPFVGSAPFRVSARLRYRIESRKLIFWYETVNPHLVIRQVVQDTVDLIQDQTKLAPFMGSFSRS